MLTKESLLSRNKAPYLPSPTSYLLGKLPSAAY